MSKTVLIPFALPVILLSAVVSPALPIDRYVAMTGSDTADGSELAPFATISHAVTVLAADADIQAGTSIGVVHVAAGTYTETGFDDSGIGSYAAGPTTVSITAPIHVVGATGNPADVIVTRGSQNINTARIFALNHADALLRYITVQNGRLNTRDQFGGNIAIGSAGGTVEDCILDSGMARQWNNGGGNIGMLGGRISRCILKNGTLETRQTPADSMGGSNACLRNGVMENCLVTGGLAGYGSVSLFGSAKVVNCDIVANASQNAPGVAILDANFRGGVYNTAIWGNTIVNEDLTGHNTVYMPYWGNKVSVEPDAATYATLSAAVSGFFHNCFAPIAINADCITGDPAFLNPSEGNYAIGMLSCLRDVGSGYADAGAISTTDLAGNPRMADGAVDIGCYEFASSGFSADFTFTPRSLFIPTVVDVNIQASGGSGTVTYTFDYDGDGEADFSTTQTNFELPWNLAGEKTITMKATDASTTVDAPSSVRCVFAPKDIYVQQGNAGAAYPYATWETAGTDLAEAVAMAIDGCTIWVGDGFYRSDTDPIVLNKPVSIIGASGNPATVVVTNSLGRATSADRDRRNFVIDNRSAFIANLTMADGSVYYEGNVGCNVTFGSNGGTVSNCILHAGYAVNWNTPTGGAYIYNGLLTHSVIRNATMNQMGKGDKAVAAYLVGAGAKMSNCLIRDVRIDASYQSSVVRVDNGTVENCTIVDCSTGVADRFGVKCNGGTVLNTAVFHVVGANDGRSGLGGGNAAGFVNCASDDAAVPNASCVRITEADFHNYTAGNYEPTLNGNLHNAGSSDPAYVANYAATDLAGNPRVFGTRPIDIGCYEYCKLDGTFFMIR